MNNTIDLSAFPSLANAVEVQSAVWPEHRATLIRSLETRDQSLMTLTEVVAALVTKIAEAHATGLEEVCKDYRYFCQEMKIFMLLHMMKQQISCQLIGRFLVQCTLVLKKLKISP